MTTIKLRCKSIFFLSLIIALLTNYSFVYAANYGDHQYCADSEGGSNAVKADVAGVVDLSLKLNPMPIDIEKLNDYCQKGAEKVTECTGASCFALDYFCTPLSDGRHGYNTYTFDCIKQGYSGCKNGACTNDISSQTASCTDKEKNQDEIDVDCGGSCGKCDIGKRCNENSGCIRNLCKDGICSEASPTCADGIKNGNEENVDCGGSCKACPVTLAHPAENPENVGQQERQKPQKIVVSTENPEKTASAVAVGENPENKETRQSITVKDERPEQVAAAVEVVHPQKETVQYMREEKKPEPTVDKQKEEAKQNDLTGQPLQKLRANNQGGIGEFFNGIANFFKGGNGALQEKNQEIINSQKTASLVQDLHVKELCRDTVREELSGFFASCESSWDDLQIEVPFGGGRRYFIETYGSCENYCKAAEGKTCLTSIAQYKIKVPKGPSRSQAVADDVCNGLPLGSETCSWAAEEAGISDGNDYKSYPAYRSIGCGYQDTGEHYSSIKCICCSFPP